MAKLRFVRNNGNINNNQLELMRVAKRRLQDWVYTHIHKHTNTQTHHNTPIHQYMIFIIMTIFFICAFHFIILWKSWKTVERKRVFIFP